MQKHGQAVDPNLVRLAAAFDVAASQMGQPTEERGPKGRGVEGNGVDAASHMGQPTQGGGKGRGVEGNGVDGASPQED